MLRAVWPFYTYNGQTARGIPKKCRGVLLNFKDAPSGLAVFAQDGQTARGIPLFLKLGMLRAVWPFWHFCLKTAKPPEASSHFTKTARNFLGMLRAVWPL